MAWSICAAGWRRPWCRRWRWHLGLTALLLLTVARGDLLESWQARVPANAPNRFAINIQPDQRVAIADFFKARGLPAPELEPMVRGRLVQVNAQAVGPESYADDRAQRLVDREFNLSWSAELPVGNTVTDGRWHGATQGGGVLRGTGIGGDPESQSWAIV
jgi:putative ABC transport system permease protein